MLSSGPVFAIAPAERSAVQIAATTPSDRGLGIQGFLTDQFATTLYASVIPSAGEHWSPDTGDVTGVTVPFGVGIAADAGGTVTSRIRRSVHGSRFRPVPNKSESWVVISSMVISSRYLFQVSSSL